MKTYTITSYDLYRIFCELNHQPAVPVTSDWKRHFDQMKRTENRACKACGSRGQHFPSCSFDLTNYGA